MKKSLRHLCHLDKLSRRKHDIILGPKKVKTKKNLTPLLYIEIRFKKIFIITKISYCTILHKNIFS